MPVTVLHLWVIVVMASRKFVLSFSSSSSEFLQTGHDRFSVV